MSPSTEPDVARHRRLARLHDELVDEQVPVPVDGSVGDALLVEVDHARHPPVHEGHVATYGALVTSQPLASVVIGPQHAECIDLDDVPLTSARRFADGRGAFLVRGPEGAAALACFEHSIEYEANLVELANRTGAHIVQRTGRGHVKILTPDAVVVWDGIRWLQKPHADTFHTLIRRLVPEVDLAVLAGLLELTVHWLSPAFRGATFVWSLHRPAAALEGLDRQRCVPGPALQVTRREHFAALFSIHGQLDGATLVAPDGTCQDYGTILVPTREAVAVVPPHRGTRHTSARRFSYDHPGTVVFVVSEDGPLSVYLDGARIALVAAEPAQTTSTGTRQPGPQREQHLRCPSCDRILIVDLPRDDDLPRQALECPVCGEPAGQVSIGATARGVSTPDQQRRADRPESTRS